MTLVGIVAFLHVVTAILWVGGASVMTLLGARALKNGDGPELMTIMKQMAYLARVIFVPASVVMLVLGLYLSWQYSALLSFWVIFGILGLVASGAIGGMILSPMLKEYNAMDLSGGATPESKALVERFLSVCKADMVLLYVLVFDMVVNPGWSNFITWILMLLVLAAGVFFFLPRDLLPSRPGLERTRDFGVPTGTKTLEDDDDQ